VGDGGSGLGQGDGHSLLVRARARGGLDPGRRRNARHGCHGIGRLRCRSLHPDAHSGRNRRPPVELMEHVSGRARPRRGGRAELFGRCWGRPAGVSRRSGQAEPQVF
jgi:hypothetical protein